MPELFYLGTCCTLLYSCFRAGGYIEESTATKANNIGTWLVHGDAFFVNSMELIYLQKKTVSTRRGSDIIVTKQ